MSKQIGRLTAVALLFAGPLAAAEPEPLIFSSGDNSYVVPEEGLTSLEAGDEGGLTLCFSDKARNGLVGFTSSHIGDTVTVAIGEREVFHLQVVEPYEEGCIVWPLHPHIASTYRRLLTGEPGEE